LGFDKVYIYRDFLIPMPTWVHRHARRIRARPYWHCVTRAAMTACLRTLFVTAIAERALLGVLVTEAMMSFTTSRNVGLRAATRLEHFDRWWSVGAVVGVTAGMLITHLVYHPWDTVWWNPGTWSNWPFLHGVIRALGS
jgi:hypothetical protein